MQASKSSINLLLFHVILFNPLLMKVYF